MDKYKILNQVDDDLVKEMIKLDNLVFKDDDIGSFDRCKEWLDANPDIYTVLLLNNKVIGYINFMRIKDEVYDLIKLGKLKDYELNKEHILNFEKGKPLKCLLTSIVVKPEYQDTIAIIKLWKGFIKMIKSKNLSCPHIIIDCVSDSGEKYVKKHLSAKYITNSQNGKIYEGYIKQK